MTEPAVFLHAAHADILERMVLGETMVRVYEERAFPPSYTELLDGDKVERISEDKVLDMNDAWIIGGGGPGSYRQKGLTRSVQVVTLHGYRLLVKRRANQINQGKETKIPEWVVDYVKYVDYMQSMAQSWDEPDKWKQSRKTA